jgi:hypothetical protein
MKMIIEPKKVKSTSSQDGVDFNESSIIIYQKSCLTSSMQRSKVESFGLNFCKYRIQICERLLVNEIENIKEIQIVSISL